MNVLLLYMVPPRRFIPRGYASGLGYLASVLKRAGHSTELIYVESLDRPSLAARIAALAPGLVGVSSTTDQFPLAREVIPFTGTELGIPTVLGGVHATVSPEEALKTPGLLGICRGEGEAALLELVQALEAGEDYTGTRNFWFKSQGGIQRNELRPLVGDLDSLPFPDREIFDYRAVLDANYDDGAEFSIGRGCPFRCTFCINATLQDLYRGNGKYVRYRSVGNVIAEIDQVLASYHGIRRITFQDDILCLNRAWLEEFCTAYGARFAIPFRCNLRADNVSEEVLSLLRTAGCKEVWVGVECGNDERRNVVLNKGVSSAQIEGAFTLLRRYGIQSKAFNMIGLPGETGAHVEETIALNKKIKPDISSVTIFRPYPGTALYETCRDNGWISDRQVSGYWEESILDQPTLTREETYFYQVLYYYEMKLPCLAPLVRFLHRIPLGPRVTLFRLLHSKKILYWLHRVLKRWGRRDCRKKGSRSFPLSSR